MSSLIELLEIFDVEPVGDGRFRGLSDGGLRQMADGSQVLAQAIVAAAKTLPDKSVRSAHAVFGRAVAADRPLFLDVDVVRNGRTFATAVVTATQDDRVCCTFTVVLDVPYPDVIRHATPLPAITGPDGAFPCGMPLPGRELRLVDVPDPNDPDEVGPAALDAWLHYDPVPGRDDLRKALLAHFTGHLSISTTMRGHAGIGTAQAHKTVSTAVLTISVVFHEPVGWDSWLLYRHDSVFAGAGTSYVRGQIFTQSGALLASFGQEGMIRAFAADRNETAIPVAARL